MGIGTGILNLLGAGLENRYRKEFESLSCAVFEEAPIDTAKTLFCLFGRGAIIELLAMHGETSSECADDFEYQTHEMLAGQRRRFRKSL